MIRVGALVLGLVLTRVAPAQEEPQPPVPETTTPIEHVITLMQESHSFDNYFGTYPGADGLPSGTCIPVDPAEAGGRCIVPFPLTDRPVTDAGNPDGLFARQYGNGAMDGFVSAFKGDATGEQSMGYYDDEQVPLYWNTADNYVLFDKFFASATGGSLWNHFYWIAGQPGNPESDVVKPEGFADVTTIFDRLEEKGISWKFYVENYDPSITYRNTGDGDRAAQISRVPLLTIPRFLDDPRLNRRIVPLDQYFVDLQNDELPAVSYIVPSASSERPPRSAQAGERLFRSLLNELMRSKACNTSTFLLTYDNSVGWYDHVAPPQVDRYGYGFRVPALLVSAYARQGYVDSTVLDFTSILKFIEENWNLEPLSQRDAAATSFASALDFEQPPRRPVLLDRERDPSPPVRSLGKVVYLSYGGVACLSVALLSVGMVTTHWRRRAAG